jgi:hypothetical protein
MWGNLARIPIKRPLAFGLCISTAKTSACDLLVQITIEKKERIDWRRNAFFGAFGFFYLGGAQYALYVPLFGRIFPGAAEFAAKSVKEKLKDGRGLAALFGQLFLDQFVVSPFVYFPAFYAAREIVVNADKPDMGRAMTAYRKNMTEDLFALWKIWVPSMFLNFAFMPMWARIRKRYRGGRVKGCRGFFLSFLISSFSSPSRIISSMGYYYVPFMDLHHLGDARRRNLA